jgi:hypothetical protein
MLLQSLTFRPKAHAGSQQCEVGFKPHIIASQSCSWQCMSLTCVCVGVVTAVQGACHTASVSGGVHVACAAAAAPCTAP